MFFIAYGFSIIAMVVDNFNLGLFALMLVLLTVLGYYIKPENEYFVWSYSLSPKKFLIEKIKIAFLFTSYLVFPILILLGFFNFENQDALLKITYLGKYTFDIENIVALILFTFVGFLLLATIILAKYSAYPKEIGIFESILLIGIFMFPALVVVAILLFANKSIKKLKFYLK
jgi:hypothetical protein